MAERERIIASLIAIVPELHSRFAVETLALFGSVARGEETGRDGAPKRNVDILVTFHPTAPVTLFTLAALTSLFEDRLGRPVDVVEDHPRLRPTFRAAIAKDLLRIA